MCFGGPARERTSLSAVEAVAKMPYDFSPVRLHCMHLVALAYEETPAATTDPVL